MKRYIDADKAKEVFHHKTGGSSFDSFIDDIPTADVVEVRCSKWKLHKDGSGTCKNCNTHQKNVWDMDRWQNYCGHCGTKMEGGNK